MVVNKAGLVEIGCKNWRLIKTIIGLSIFLVTNDCNFLINGLVLINSDDKVDGMSPQFLFGLNHTLSKSYDLDTHKISNTIVTIVNGWLMLSMWIVVCIKVKCKKITQYEKVEQTKPENVFEMENLNKN